MIPRTSTCCSSPTTQDQFGWPRCTACGRIQRESTGLSDNEALGGYVYLASPYSHPNPAVREARFHAVQDAVVDLFKRGVYSYSPIAHCHPIALRHSLPLDAAWWEGYNHAMIDWAKALYVLKLPGWEDSRGVAEELAYAKRIGLTIRDIYLPPPLVPSSPVEPL